VLCQTAAAVPTFATMEFSGPIFASGHHDRFEQLVLPGQNSRAEIDQFKNPDGKTLQEVLNSASTWRAIQWQVQAGHDVDELAGAAIKSHQSNLNLAAKRLTYLRNSLSSLLSTNLQVPISLAILSNSHTDAKLDATKSRDRTPKIILSYYTSPPTTANTPAFTCAQISGELKAGVLQTSAAQ
jgi:hypothetical protein